LNGTFIAVDGMKIDENGFVRYKCLSLDNPTKSLGFIKESNLKDLPLPSIEDLNESDILIREIPSTFREIRNSYTMSSSTNLKPLYDLAQQKLDNLKKVNPGRGALYALCGAFATLKDHTHVDFVGPPPNSLSELHLSFMKIAVANLDDREEDYGDEDLLKTRTRTAYAAILGNSRDFHNNYYYHIHFYHYHNPHKCHHYYMY
jgi:hypothetical protein